jgi:predicted metal-dependent peptidase
MTKAKAALILDQPFVGALACHLNIKESRMVPTGATDGVRLIFNPDWVADMPIDQVKGFVAHEVWHLVLKHQCRRSERNPVTWNIAGDFVINGILQEAGFSLPSTQCLRDDFKGKSTDEVYNIIYKEELSSGDQQPHPSSSCDQDGQQQLPGIGGGGEDDEDDENDEDTEDNDSSDSDGDDQDQDSEDSGDQNGQTGSDGKSGKKSQSKSKGGGQQGQQSSDSQEQIEDVGGCGVVLDAPKDASGQDTIKQQEEDWEIWTRQAMQAAKMVGNMPGNMAELIEATLDPKQTWREILKDFMDTISKNDYSWALPNSRYVQQGVYLPGLRSEELGTIVIGVDTSGSVGQVELQQFAAEISSILDEFEAFEVDVLYCDTDIRHKETFTSSDMPIVLHARGGGGTKFKPFFDRVAKDYDADPPKAIIYFTDMGAWDWGDLKDPDVPVLWADTWGHKDEQDVPFGEIININVNE